ncbi:MAG TPA: hypothetical protein DCQ78_01530 [Ruminococcus sp.]|nr:hypothetical protein [Ruminococcus sp.]
MSRCELTTREVKKWLQQASRAKKELENLEVRLKVAKMQAEGIKGIKEYNYITSSGTKGNSIENDLFNVCEIQQLYDSRKKAYKKLISDMTNTISKLNDYEFETVLICRYLLFNTISETAEIMHYSIDTVKLRTNQAIEKFTHLSLA